MWRFLSQVLATLIAFVLLLILVPVIFGIIAAANQEAPPGTMVLTLDMRAPLPDKAPVNPLRMAGPITARSAVGVVQTLREAETDDRVKGLYLRVGGVGLPIAQVQELREAVASFKASGKFVVAHTQSIYSTGLGSYYLGASADDFWMQPNGQIYASGTASSTLFMKDLFDKIGVEADFKALKEYKNAPDTFRETDYTDPMREASTALVNTVYDAVIGDLAADREMGVDALMARFNNSPSVGDNALERGLIDDLVYEADARETVLSRAGDGAELVELDDYLDLTAMSRMGTNGDGVIALIHGDGSILEGESTEISPFGGESVIGGDTMARAIRTAADDREVKAIVLRVNSPGGSAVASEQIRYAVAHARDAGKPVIVSMGNVAASGGYWISMTADKIVAHPATLTGSIGVFLGKFVIADMFEKIGLNQGEIAKGDGALLFSAQAPFTDDEWSRIDRGLDAIYDEFVSRAAEGRDMSEAELERYARGRVWAGADARARGLVDEFGGVRTAIALAQEAAGIDPSIKVELRTYPKPPGIEEFFEDLFQTSGEFAKVIRTLHSILALPPIAALTQAADAAERDGIMAVEEAEPVH